VSIRRVFALLLVAALVAPLGAAALEVRSDHDESVDLSGVASYRWVPGTPVDVPAVQSLLDSAVRAQLEAGGLSEDSESPDVWVVVHAAIDERSEFEPSSYGYSYPWRRWGPTSVNFRQMEPGMLVVDVVDAKSAELAWRGIAMDAIPQKIKKIEKAEKGITKAAVKLFEGFPPAE
jgi:hypothetical protein